MVRSRFAAAGIHLGLSALVLAALFLVVFLVWYPPPFFSIAGAGEPALVLAGVDLVLGPLLTLLVYDIGKRSLRFDLSVIVVVQLAALGYGGWALASQRPVFMVFDSGYFEVVAWPDIGGQDVPPQIAEAVPLAGPAVVWAEPVDDPAFVLEAILGEGRDVNLIPSRYRPLVQGQQVLRTSGQSLPVMMERDDNVRRAVEALLEDGKLNGKALSGLRIYPVYGRQQNWAVIVDADVPVIVDYLNVPVSWNRPGSDEALERPANPGRNEDAGDTPPAARRDRGAGLV